MVAFFVVSICPFTVLVALMLTLSSVASAGGSEPESMRSKIEAHMKTHRVKVGATNRAIENLKSQLALIDHQLEINFKILHELTTNYYKAEGKHEKNIIRYSRIRNSKIRKQLHDQQDQFLEVLQELEEARTKGYVPESYNDYANTIKFDPSVCTGNTKDIGEGPWLMPKSYLNSGKAK